MGRTTFDSETLCREWSNVARDGGTRKDVILAVLNATGQDAADKEAYSKCYNNVQQRITLLSRKGVTFPELNGGKRERITADTVATLNAFFTSAPSDDGNDADQQEGGDDAPAEEGGEATS